MSNTATRKVDTSSLFFAIYLQDLHIYDAA